MKYFYIEPEVAGELGENTVLDSRVHPPKVDRLHYKFSGWLGDVLVESFPCVISTEEAARSLQAISASGVQYCDVQVSMSPEFLALYPDKSLPEFIWLKITGTPGLDDFGMASDLRLVASEKVIESLRALGLENAIIEPFV